MNAPPASDLTSYVAGIDAFNATRPDMDPVRDYNHQMIDILAQLRPIHGKALLDVGASPHGYGLERALQKGASLYVGIGLGVSASIEVRDGSRVGRLMKANAEEIPFEAETFDLIMSLSTFEHFSDGMSVLSEMYRVAKAGGSALINFQPVWTSSRGHHLHHIPSVSRMIPPWAHLLWNRQTMRSVLQGRWPTGAAMSLTQAIDWIYASTEINRIDVIALRTMFERCNFEIEWLTPLVDDDGDNKPLIAEYLATILPYSARDLMTLGFSMLLNKRGTP